jgi:hypothetical protein
MPRLTAIELSQDACVLIRASVRGTSVEVRGVETLDPAAFPGGGTFTAALRHARQSGRFRRRARVVLWGVPDGARPADPAVRPRLEPLIKAGFRIDRVVSPCNALAALARIRPPKPDSTLMWLAIDNGGVAMVAVRPGELLYSHEFVWDSSVGARGSQARLLQRYSLVAYLAPEVRRAMAAVREKGGRVDAVVTCGTLPDLRSLTMPMIEELDVEVETLDSLDGLSVKPDIRERLLEVAPSIRIACAGAMTRVSRPRTPSTAAVHGTWFRIAALVALLALTAAATGFVVRRWSPVGAPSSGPPAARSVQRPSSAAPVAAPPLPRPSVPPSTPVTTAAGARAATTPAVSQPPIADGRKPAESALQTPRLSVPPPTPPVQSRATSETATGGPPRTSAEMPNGPLYAPTVKADKTRAEPLKDPLPNVSTILVSPTRRFAMVDGRIVGVGDHVGSRIIAAIEPRVVGFREPSGLQIRVGLGGRRVPDDRK